MATVGTGGDRGRRERATGQQAGRGDERHEPTKQRRSHVYPLWVGRERRRPLAPVPRGRPGGNIPSPSLVRRLAAASGPARHPEGRALGVPADRPPLSRGGSPSRRAPSPARARPRGRWSQSRGGRRCRPARFRARLGTPTWAPSVSASASRVPRHRCEPRPTPRRPTRSGARSGSRRELEATRSGGLVTGWTIPPRPSVLRGGGHGSATRLGRSLRP